MPSVAAAATAAAAACRARHRASPSSSCSPVDRQRARPIRSSSSCVGGRADGAGSRGSRCPRRTADRRCSRSARSRRAAARRAGSRRSRTTARRRPRARTARRRGSRAPAAPRRTRSRRSRGRCRAGGGCARPPSRTPTSTTSACRSRAARGRTRRKREVHLAEQLGVELVVERCEDGGDLVEVRRAAIGLLDRAPVRAPPAGVGDPRLVDALVVAALRLHRDRQPAQSVGRLDPVAVAPVAARVLHVVEQHERVDLVHEVEVAAPRDVVGLHDRHAAAGARARPPAASRARSASPRPLTGCPPPGRPR